MRLIDESVQNTIETNCVYTIHSSRFHQSIDDALRVYSTQPSRSQSRLAGCVCVRSVRSSNRMFFRYNLIMLICDVDFDVFFSRSFRVCLFLNLHDTRIEMNIERIGIRFSERMKRKNFTQLSIRSASPTIHLARRWRIARKLFRSSSDDCSMFWCSVCSTRSFWCRGGMSYIQIRSNQRY